MIIVNLSLTRIFFFRRDEGDRGVPHQDRHQAQGHGGQDEDAVEVSHRQSWALAAFFHFFHNKNDIFGIFYQVNLTGGRLFK